MKTFLFWFVSALACSCAAAPNDEMMSMDDEEQSVAQVASPLLIPPKDGSVLPLLNLAPAFRWKSRVYLNTDFDSVSAADGQYTISARFMPTYRLPHFGVLFAANGSSGHRLLLGQQIDYQKVCTDPADSATCSETWEPALSLTVDRTETIQVVKAPSGADTSVKIGQWNHVAVSYKKGSGWRVYLNGARVISVADSTFRPYGKMTIGNTSTYSKFNQYYGLIDDVAVFTKELTSGTLANLTVPELPANMVDMKWGWSFNASGSLTSATPAPTYGSNATPVSITKTRSNSDVSAIPKPIQSATYKLPIQDDLEVLVVKGNSSDHHSGPWAWAWDFIYAGHRSDSTSKRIGTDTYALNKKWGRGKPLTAAASGHVVHANWDVVEGDGSDVPNSVQIRHAPGEYSSYYHFATDSFPDLFPWSGAPIAIEPVAFPAIDESVVGTSYPAVARGRVIGAEGGTGMGDLTDAFHLHYAVLDQPDLVEFGERICKPTEFVQYEYSYDRLTWQTGAGVPEIGMYVRQQL